VEVPAQPVDRAGPFVHEVLAVIDEQADLPGWPIKLRRRQVRFA
jgi:hypothetical protein